MTILFAVLGLLIGGAIGRWSGAFAGLFIGGLCGEIMALKDRVRKLEKAAASAADSQRALQREAANSTATKSIASEAAIAPPAVTPPATVLSNVAVAASDQSSAVKQTASPVAPREPARVAPPRSPQRREPQASPIFKWLKSFFTDGNAVVRISVIVLFVGVAFLVQYAAERKLFPIELRLMSAAALALAFLFIGWRLRQKRAGFALTLQGGATAVMYLVIFASLRLYGVLPPALAFALLLLVVALSAMLAVLQNSMWLAVLGIGGGFLAPILTSTGQGNHVMLFSFYAVLNVGILGIAWYKSWRALNVLGFLFTFVIGAAWGVTRYTPALFASTEPFLILFFLFYVAIAVLFASRQSPELKGYVDGTLVFGVPVTAFALQASMLKDEPYLLSASALAVAALYVGLARTLLRKRVEWQLLIEAFVALGIAFATLAIPLALNGRWSAATWALEGAALVWVGCRQSRLLPRLAGLGLQVAAAAMIWRDAGEFFDGWPLLNSTFLGAALVASAAIFSSHLLYRYADRLHANERWTAAGIFWWGYVWWLVAGIGQIDRELTTAFETHAVLLFVALSSAAISAIAVRFAVPAARWAALMLLPAMLLISLIDLVDVTHPAVNYGWLAWPAALAVWYWALRRHETSAPKQLTAMLHAVSYWLLIVILAAEALWWVGEAVDGAGSWRIATWVLLFCAAILSRHVLQTKLPWPLARHARTYSFIAETGVIAVLTITSLLLAGVNGDAYPLRYLPILNPLDIAQLFVLLSIAAWWRRCDASVGGDRKQFPLTREHVWIVLAALGFIWLNVVLLRTIHHWAGVPYIAYFLWQSPLVQASLSILWTVIALATVWIAARQMWRAVWFVGVALLGVELLKLFFVDLSASGSVARIVSFMGVGILGVLIGYVSPLPPAEERKQ